MHIVRTILALAIATSAAHAQEFAVKRLPAPDFKSAAPKAPAKPGVKLRIVSEKANKITDDDAWFATNELELNRETVLPDGLPDEVHGLRFLKAVRSGERVIGFYGADYSGATIVVGLDPRGNVAWAYDFSTYRLAPRNVEEDLGFVEQQVQWAEQRGDILYVSHGHNTYAKSSHGMNAYVTAIDTRTGKSLWHSPPLVSNAANFLILGDHLITGYGFTAEPDFLYALRLDDGSVAAKLPLKSGPSYIVEKDGKLYVRTYNRDYVVGAE